jgi:hypothetical protein
MAVRSMQWKSVAVTAALVLGATNMMTHVAFSRGMSGGAHFGGRGFADYRFATGRGFARPFRRNFATAGLWPYYDGYIPTGTYGDTNTAPYPGPAAFAPEAIPSLVCHRSEEMVRVPSERGGTSEIKVIRCP